MVFICRIVLILLTLSEFCYAITPNYILVDKSSRKLSIINGESILKTFDISLGFEPIGKKTKQGDGKTPEGLYFIEKKLNTSAFYLALQISYPNPWDIRQALTNGYHPGGQIMIHGIPNKRYDKNYHNKNNDWTEGCIAISNKEVLYLWNIIEIGTPVLIRK